MTFTLRDRLTPSQMHAAELLRQRRTEWGMTQEEMASLLDADRNTVAKWERFAVAIRHPRMVALALHAIEQKRANGEEFPQS